MSNLFTALTKSRKNQLDVLEKQAKLSSVSISPKSELKDKEVKTQPQTSPKKKEVVLQKQTKEKQQSHDTTTPRHRDTMIPQNHDTVIPRYHDTMIETVRKAVKIFGKEAATHRFTVEEKKAVAEVIYLFRQQDIRTSENEIARIAINFLVEDYKKNGRESVLDKVLKALND